MERSISKRRAGRQTTSIEEQAAIENLCRRASPVAVDEAMLNAGLDMRFLVVQLMDIIKKGGDPSRLRGWEIAARMYAQYDGSALDDIICPPLRSQLDERTPAGKVAKVIQTALQHRGANLPLETRDPDEDTPLREDVADDSLEPAHA